MAAFRWLTLGWAALLLAAPGVAEWRQWRGPDGAGVATEAQALPESWQEDGSGIRWATRIRGEGISSPVASGGRVFLTTAYESELLLRLRATCVAATVALAALFLLLLVRRWWKARGGSSGGGRWDGRAVALLSVVFAIFAAYISLRPEEFFEISNPGRAYRLGGGIAMLGLGAAFGWFERGSGKRLLGAALLALGAALFLIFMPASSYGPTPLSKSLPFLVPAVAMALWFGIGYWRGRGRAPAGGDPSPLLAAILVLMAALFYAPINVLNGLDRVVVCLDEGTGEVLWERTVFTSPPEKKWENSSYATPTPVADGEIVFVYFGTGLAALDYDGTVLWRESFPGYTQRTRYGASTSPLLHGDLLILGRERELNHPGDDSWLAAWDKSTGRRLWRRVLDDAHDSYATPTLFESGGGTQVIIPSWMKLLSHDADTGERLWSLDYPMEQLVASMAWDGDLLAVTGGAYGDRFLVVYRLSGEGAETRAETLWKTNRGVSAISSPVIYDGKLFTVSVPGIMTVYEAATGKQIWKKRLDGEHYASLVAGDGKVYAVSTEGSVTVVAASEPSVLAVNELDGTVYSSPAISNGCLMIRTSSHLFCIEGEARQARVGDPPDADPS